ncbi:MAG TPA: hypothetical protein VJV79_22880 [Polyangiaceae bacterium]|nr:hypothetical protein [Polyangiaceae bacterium]
MKMSQSNPIRARLPGMAWLWFISALGGCALQGAVPLSTADDEAAASDGGQGLGSYTAEYSWEQRQPSKRMLRSNGNVCFLTGVHGKFRGTSEMVKISNVRGYYYLTGISKQVGVGATARCFPYDSTKVVATQFRESAADGDLDLGVHRVCALSRVSGDFEGGDEVKVYQASNGHWFLQVVASGSGINGGAMCLDDDPAVPFRTSREYSVQTGDPLIIASNLRPDHSEPTEPLQGPACFLTSMAGKFSSRDDRVEAYVASAKGAWNFYLRARGAEPSVATSGVCLR